MRCPRVGKVGAIVGIVVAAGCQFEGPVQSDSDFDREIAFGATSGQQVFRFETFGNERFWTDTLRLHEAIQTVDPVTALSVGLKVDSDRLPPGFLANADLSDPATTVELLRRDAILGVRAKVDEGVIQRLGITCAFCHSTVDNASGIGRRLDGWPNSDLDVGAIVALSSVVQKDAALLAVLNTWEPGFYDPYFNQDGLNHPVVIPPAYGLQGVPLETYTGEGPISYWNAYVAVTQMHGQGDFSQPLLGISIDNSPDLVTRRLPLLLAYQLSLPAPPPPPGSFDEAAAQDGQAVFAEACASCHVPPTFTDAPNLHAPGDTDMDGTYAARTTTGQYRATPLRALWQHPPYFHDGSAETLGDVVDHYVTALGLTLSTDEREDLIEYLKSL
ncbi:MAG TPA: c-type cytochrome [Gemmatimonadota bacterium]|nr:c-type cytochrome [Gemmatimonadota bacterium]